MKHEWTFPVTIESNYDGDTLRCAFDIGFGLRYYDSIRLDGVDTPELRGGTPLTKAAAKFARDTVAHLVEKAEQVIFHSTVWKGKYGRPVGRLFLDGRDLAEMLIERRLGVFYDGGWRNPVAHEVNAKWLLNQGLITLEEEK